MGCRAGLFALRSLKEQEDIQKQLGEIGKSCLRKYVVGNRRIYAALPFLKSKALSDKEHLLVGGTEYITD
jgi:hypothetical protein